MYIQEFSVKKLWGRLDLSWEHINHDVNIIVGINGCGKTTLLNLIYDSVVSKSYKASAAQ